MKYLFILLLAGCMSNNNAPLNKDQAKKEYDTVLQRITLNKQTIDLMESMLKGNDNTQNNVYLMKQIDSIKKDQERLSKRRDELSKEIL